MQRNVYFGFEHISFSRSGPRRGSQSRPLAFSLVEPRKHKHAAWIRPAIAQQLIELSLTPATKVQDRLQI